jgi:hypothetical protein
MPKATKQINTSDDALIALGERIAELRNQERDAVNEAIRAADAVKLAEQRGVCSVILLRRAPQADARVAAFMDAADRLLVLIFDMPHPATLEGVRALAKAILYRCEHEGVSDQPESFFERGAVALLEALAGETV